MSFSPLNLVLSQVFAQLDGITRVVRLPANVFNGLDEYGRASTREQMSMLLGYPVDFYLDSRDIRRIWLGNIIDIQSHWPCIPRHILGARFPMLFPVFSYGPGVMNAANSNPQHTPDPAVTTTGPEEFLDGIETPEAPPKNPQPSESEESEWIPKPPNAFILYRSHSYKAVRSQHSGSTNGQVSQIIADQWNAMSETQRAPWKALANAKRDEHHEKHPNYQYRPGLARKRTMSRSTRKPDKRQKRQQHLAQKASGQTETEGQVRHTQGLYAPVHQAREPLEFDISRRPETQDTPAQEPDEEGPRIWTNEDGPIGDDYWDQFVAKPGRHSPDDEPDS
ncbi:hypothetical protein HD806DRAFT_546864 [Xylariaceae sp. AK1471]|nr:hypothetical protein HD806DRAFT_546864 [Xylariaceae sp. AK1471]